MKFTKTILTTLFLFILSTQATAQTPPTPDYYWDTDCFYSHFSDQASRMQCFQDDGPLEIWMCGGSPTPLKCARNAGKDAYITFMDCTGAQYEYISFYSTLRFDLTLVAGPEQTCEDQSDPLVFDLDGDGFNFSNVDTDPVFFDVNSDGIQEEVAWTIPNDDDAFLVLDRNENNLVDDGTELFGNGTYLLSGEQAEFGYIALTELDDPAWGGNGDGIISKDDDQFKRLRFWTDSNQDGISENSEIRTMQSKGVREISLDYEFLPETDEFGNGLIFQGTALKKERGQDVYIDVVDVIFKQIRE